MRQRSWQSMMGCLYGVTVLLLQGCVSYTGPTGTFQVPVHKANPFGANPGSVGEASPPKLKAAVIVSDPFLRATTNIRVQCSVTNYTYVLRTGKEYVNTLVETLPTTLSSQVTVIPSRASAPTGYDLYVELSVPKITAEPQCVVRPPKVDFKWDNFGLSLRGNGVVRITDKAGQILAEIPWDKTYDVKHATQGFQADTTIMMKTMYEEDGYPQGAQIEIGIVNMSNSLLALYRLAMNDLKDKLQDSEDLRKYLQSQ